MTVVGVRLHVTACPVRWGTPLEEHAAQVLAEALKSAALATPPVRIETGTEEEASA